MRKKCDIDEAEVCEIDECYDGHGVIWSLLRLLIISARRLDKASQRRNVWKDFSSYSN
jgi:hypothetical protein